MANILVVDDVKSVRDNVIKTLSKQGHNLDEASNGEECIKILQDKSYDLIILDIMMPEKGGIDTLVEIKNYKDIKKIIITGMVLPESEALNNLITHYDASKILFKPFKQDQLINAVDEVLAS